MENTDIQQTKTCRSCFRLLQLNHFSLNRRTKSGYSEYCLQCIKGSRRLKDIRKWGIVRRARTIHPHLVWNIAVQNRECLQLGFIRANCELPAYHVITGEYYTFQFESTPAGQYVRLFDPNKVKEVEWMIPGFQMEMFTRLVAQELKDRKIRLEKDDLTCYESRTVIYGFERS